jgi:hypothetical protein
VPSSHIEPAIVEMVTGSDGSLLEAENARLKKMLAESQLVIEVMKEVAAKKW